MWSRLKLLVCTVLIVLSSCTADVPMEKDFIGTWRVHAKNKETHKSLNTIVRFTFLQKGIFGSRTEFYKATRGSWHFKKNKLQIQLDSSKIIGKIISIDSNEIKLDAISILPDSSLKTFELWLSKEPFTLTDTTGWL